MAHDEGLQEKIRALNAIFSEKLPDRLRELDLVLQQCLDEPANQEHVIVLHRLLHTLAGSAGTFGFVELGLSARRLEKEAKGLTDTGGGNKQDLTQFAAGVQELLHSTAVAPKGKTEMHPQQQVLQRDVNDRSVRPVYLVDDDALQAENIAIQLQYFGYELVIISELSRLAAAVEERIPAAIIMNLPFPHGITAGAAEIARITQHCAAHFSVIFLSDRETFAARLAAVQAGADGYFVKPVDMVALVDRLDALTARKEVTPYRILIIDDHIETAEYCAAILRGAGMDVNILCDLTDTLQILREYRPELVLMDVYMPECSGIDLAKLIRQEAIYIDVPIVFLSIEDNMSKQLDAIRAGADDFLTKPIEAAHLISSLSSRAERYRALRGLIMCDSLTGLYNHSSIKEHLVREISRAERGAAPLTLAMIDIDFFKSVNDNYGHPAGDQVIRALSRLLLQRLRRGDLIGRYGGEEFAVIMPSTPISAAVVVLDRIREAFSKILHRAEDRDFTVTFSVGVADLTKGVDGEALFRAADAALYRAKHNGRNRVKIA